MGSVLRTSFDSGRSSLEAVFTHGTFSTVRDNPDSAVLLPCFNGARLVSASSTRSFYLPAEDDVASAVALAPRCTSTFVAGRSGFAVFTPLPISQRDAQDNPASPPRRPRTFRPFDNGVVSHAVYDSSGGLLALAPAAGMVRIYDCDAFHVTHAFALKQDLLITCLSFHPDPKVLLLYVGTEDGAIHCFDLATRSKKPVFVANHHVSAVVSLAFVNDGQWMVAAGRDRVISVSKSRRGEKLRLLLADEELVGLAALSYDKNHVVSVGDAGSLRVWDVGSGREVSERSCRVPFVSSQFGDAESGTDESFGGGEGTVDNTVSSLFPCGVGKFVVSLTDHTLVTFSISSDDEIRPQRALCGNLEQINDLQSLPEAETSEFPPDFLVASNSSLLWVLSPPKDALEPKLQNAKGEPGVGDTAGEGAVEGDTEGLESAKAGWTYTDVLHGHKGIILGVDVVSRASGKGKDSLASSGARAAFAVSGSRDKTARVWKRAETKSWYCIGIAEGHTDAVTAVALSPKTAADNFFAATASNDRTLKVWRLRNAVKTAEASLISAPVRDDVGEENLTRIVSPASGQEMQLKASWTSLAHDKDINAVAVSPDGRLIATGSQDKTVKLWDAESGVLKTTCVGHRRGVFDVTFSPVDRIVASASGDATVRIWNAVTGSCMRSLQGHSGGVLRAVFMTRGMQMASSGMDGLLKMWSVRTGECDETIDAHADAIWALDIARDGATIASGGMDGVLEIWNDATAVRAAAASARRDQEAALTQRVDDAARARSWAVAASTALELNMPRKLRAVVTDLITSTEDVDNALKEMVRGIAEPSVSQLLRYCRDWGAAGGPGNAELGCRVVRAIFSVWPPASVCEAIGGEGRALVEALVAHTRRHEGRVSGMAARARFVDYTLEVMRALPEEKAKGDKKAKKFELLKPESLKRKSVNGAAEVKKRRKRGHAGEATEY